MTALTDADLDRMTANGKRALDAGNSMRIDAPDFLALIALARRAQRMEEVLREFIRWADRKCPCHNEEPNPCPLCGASVENLEPCKAADNTLPLRLLQDTRAILSEPGALHGGKPQ